MNKQALLNKIEPQLIEAGLKAPFKITAMDYDSYCPGCGKNMGPFNPGHDVNSDGEKCCSPECAEDSDDDGKDDKK